MRETSSASCLYHGETGLCIALPMKPWVRWGKPLSTRHVVRVLVVYLTGWKFYPTPSIRPAWSRYNALGWNAGWLVEPLISCKGRLSPSSAHALLSIREASYTTGTCAGITVAPVVYTPRLLEIVQTPLSDRGRLLNWSGVWCSGSLPIAKTGIPR